MVAHWLLCQRLHAAVLVGVSLAHGQGQVSTIDGSTDRRCFAIVTNERALISSSDQPVRKVRQTPYCVFQAGKQTFKDRHICAMV